MLRLLQFGRSNRHRDHLDVPTARELASGAQQRKTIELMEAPFALTRPYVAPPDVPAARATALQRAFMAVQRDPAYLEEASRLKLDVSPIGPAEVAALLSSIAHAPEATKAEVRRLVGATRGN
jgi:tripartite-type tricarboxylate transporter receptor subunit TctC